MGPGFSTARWVRAPNVRARRCRAREFPSVEHLFSVQSQETILKKLYQHTLGPSLTCGCVTEILKVTSYVQPSISVDTAICQCQWLTHCDPRSILISETHCFFGLLKWKFAFYCNICWQFLLIRENLTTWKTYPTIPGANVIFRTQESTRGWRWSGEINKLQV